MTVYVVRDEEGIVKIYDDYAKAMAFVARYMADVPYEVLAHKLEKADPATLPPGRSWFVRIRSDDYALVVKPIVASFYRGEAAWCGYGRWSEHARNGVACSTAYFWGDATQVYAFAAARVASLMAVRGKMEDSMQDDVKKTNQELDTAILAMIATSGRAKFSALRGLGDYRQVDRRLQALKHAGQIEFDTKLGWGLKPASR